MDRAFIVTDGPNMATAREGSLKFGETLKIPTLYYENEEYVHGPNMQLDPEYTVFLLIPIQKITECRMCIRLQSL